MKARASSSPPLRGECGAGVDQQADKWAARVPSLTLLRDAFPEGLAILETLRGAQGPSRKGNGAQTLFTTLGTPQI